MAATYGSIGYAIIYVLYPNMNCGLGTEFVILRGGKSVYNCTWLVFYVIDSERMKTKFTLFDLNSKRKEMKEILQSSFPTLYSIHHLAVLKMGDNKTYMHTIGLWLTNVQNLRM